MRIWTKTPKPARKSCTASRGSWWRASGPTSKPLDSVIERFSQNWRVDRLGKIELTLLRLAVFEMLYRADVPPKVAINEALELSTRFGDAKAKSFINGILDAAIKAQEAGTLTVAGKADA